MTPEQRSAILTHCAAEMAGERYGRIRELCESQATISTGRVLRMLSEMRKRDVRRANELLRVMK